MVVRWPNITHYKPATQCWVLVPPQSLTDFHTCPLPVCHAMLTIGPTLPEHYLLDSRQYTVAIYIILYNKHCSPATTLLEVLVDIIKTRLVHSSWTFSKVNLCRSHKAQTINNICIWCAAKVLSNFIRIAKQGTARLDWRTLQHNLVFWRNICWATNLPAVRNIKNVNVKIFWSKLEQRKRCE